MIGRIACKCTGISLILLLTMTVSGLAAEVESFGGGVEIEAATPIRDIVADPDAWVGKTVRVEGQVTGVCAMKGCWMELESTDGDQLRVKVDDDVIVFPPEAEGRWAVAEGKVSAREMSRDQYVGWLRHLAEEQGETFDESSVGEGPYKLVQIQGTGAEIKASDS